MDIIRIEGLTKTFQQKDRTVAALRDVDLTIEQGEIFGIIGMSGAGKSTLVRCVNLLERPTRGKVFFDGKDLTALSEKELRAARRSMGMIFQQFNLLMQRTAERKVRFPLEIAGVPPEDAARRARELLELVGLADRADAYPSQLSGGQKQRVAIARALATDPKVLLCDEATSALDPTTTRSILQLLQDINTRLGITILVITHEMSVIEEICHRVAIISDSRIAEVGRVRDIFTRPQSEAARRLVYPEGRKAVRAAAPAELRAGGRMCRIVFDGESSFEPVIAGMVLQFQAPVNIMFADTKDIEGKAYGQIIVQLPQEESVARGMLEFVRGQGLTAEELPAGE